MRKKDPKARKQAILEAAIVAFNQHGYANTTVDEIARIAGVGKGTVYYHFKNRELIFLALVGSWVDTLYALFQEVRYDERTTEEKLRFLLEQSLLNPNRNLLYLSSEFWYYHQTNEEAITTLQQIYNRYYEIFRILLFDGMVRHEFKTWDIEELTTSFMGMIEGIYSHQLLKSRDPLTSTKAFVTGVEIFLTGIRNSSNDNREEESTC